jgi:hypothetical protein
MKVSICTLCDYLFLPQLEGMQKKTYCVLSKHVPGGEGMVKGRAVAVLN